MTLSAICCPADCMQSKKEISPLIQHPKLCADKKAKAFGDPATAPFPQLASAVLVLSPGYRNSPRAEPKELQWTADSVPRNDSLSVTQQLGWRGPQG